MARLSREACLEAGEEKPFNVSRCAIAGTQRAASTWTGDNVTDFSELRWNHKQAMLRTGYRGLFRPAAGQRAVSALAAVRPVPSALHAALLETGGALDHALAVSGPDARRAPSV